MSFLKSAKGSLVFGVVLAASVGAIATFLVGQVPDAGASTYKLPDTSGDAPPDESAGSLDRISAAVAGISKRASKAIVFVSVSKIVQGMPMGMVDPFEFFFGPGFRQGPGGGGGGQQRQAPQPRQQGLGSGFFVDLERGYVMTNNHVIEDADEITLKLANGESYQGKVVGRDKRTDLAIVQVKEKSFNKRGLDALKLGDSDKVAVGDFVVALGAPFGLEASVSFGIVSALGRNNLQITDLGEFIQTDAAINPGNSGGPLVNTRGQVIGINTAIYSRSGGYNGVGFAIPSNLARRVGDQLVNEGKVDRGFIGVGAQSIEPDMSKDLGLPDDSGGALVGNVFKGGPADKAGIEPGDVITQINERPIKSQFDLVNTVGLMRPGTRVTVTYYRNGKRANTTATLERHPDDRGGDARDSGKETTGQFGLSLSPVNASLAQKFSIESKRGAVVTDVDNGSAAERAGIQPGDVIVSVNNRPVTSPNEFWQQAKGKQRLLVRLERQGQFLFVSLRAQ